MANVVLYQNPLSLMESRLDSLLDFWNVDYAPAFNPRLEVKETDKDFRLTMEVPGMKREDIHIEVDKGMLRLTGEKKAEVDDKSDARCSYSERSYGSFERALRLPDNVDANAIHAKYSDGLLELTIPKREEVKPKALEIKVE